MYDTKIKQILNTNHILSSINCKRFINQKLKYLEEKEGYIIDDQFNNRLKNTIYSLYADNDILLLKFPIRSNNGKLALGLPDLNTYL